MTKIIGLTGGIGSGKTTIARFFMAAAIPVYIADDQARKLMQSEEIIQEIKAKFGIAIFENGILNRQKLAEIVFNNSEKLKLLNSIIHPAVKRDFDTWVLSQKEAPFIIYESAILFESESHKNCHSIITVTAPLETRIKRVMQRDNASREQIMTRINAQWNDEQRIAKSDFVIENNALETIKFKVDEILKILNN